MKISSSTVVVLAVLLMAASAFAASSADAPDKGGNSIINIVYSVYNSIYESITRFIGMTPQCSDHIDNDNNGYCDFAASGAYCSDGSILGDPGCSSKNDNMEKPGKRCTIEVCDGRDNDCDGLIDEDIICPVSITTQDLINDNSVYELASYEPSATGRYIIKLNDPSLADTYEELKEQGKSKADIKSALNQQKLFLKQNRDRVKDKILSKLPGKKISYELDIYLNGFAISLSNDELRALASMDFEIYPDIEVRTNLMDSVKDISADYSWNLGYDGTNTTIAIIDTGVDYTHPDLGGCTAQLFSAGNCPKVVGGYDFVNFDGNPMDDMGHGTHCAGIAAGSGQGGLKGVAPNAKIIAYKVLNNVGSGSFSAVIAAMERATDPNQDGDFSDHVDVISMSLGGVCGSQYTASCGPDDAVSQAVDKATDLGIVVVVAAGNSGPAAGTIGTPGVARKAITVGASYKKNYNGTYWSDANPRLNQITSFSSRGPVIYNGSIFAKPDIVAPGAIICSAEWDNVWSSNRCDGFVDDKHVQISGTSMATPHVAGAVALIRQEHPDWTPEEIKALLKYKAINLNYSIYSQGTGLLNVKGSVDSTSRPIILEIEPKNTFYGQDAVAVIGTVNGYGLKNYTLYYRTGGSGAYAEICSSSLPANDSVLCMWDISRLIDGGYELKLIAKTSYEEYSIVNQVNIDNTQILSPEGTPSSLSAASSYYLPLNKWQDINIRGVAGGYRFDHYTLNIYDMDCSSIKCINSAVVKTLTAASAVYDGSLGLLQTSNLTTGFYNITLIVYRNDNTLTTESIVVYFDAEMREGWPKEFDLYTSGPAFLSYINQPGLTDLDNDGKLEIISAYYNRIDAIDSEGNSLTGWPVELDTQYGTVQKAPAVGDIDNDGKKELVATSNGGYVYIFKNNGSLNSLIYAGSQNSPALEDVNNDGYLDIILSSSSNSNMSILDHNGNVVSSWNRIPPGCTNGKVEHSVSAGDINGDGYSDVVYIIKCVNSSTGLIFSSAILAVDYHGNLLQGWPVVFSGNNALISYSPTLADANNDGRLEIIAASQDGKLYVFGQTGNVLPGWPVNIVKSMPHMSAGEIATGDVDADGRLEIFATGKTDNQSDSECLAGCLMGFNVNGDNVFHAGSGTGGRADVPMGTLYDVSLADLDGDGQNEIMADTSSNGRLINGLSSITAFNFDGSIVNGFPKFFSIADGIISDGARIGDLDGDGKNEIVFVGKRNMYVYDTGGSTGHDKWPIFHNNEKLTGRYNASSDIGTNPTTTTIITTTSTATVPSTTTSVTTSAVSITYPANNSMVSLTVNVAITTNTAGVSKVELYRDGVLIGIDTKKPYSVAWNTKADSDGYHNLLAKAYSSSIVGMSSSVSVRVANPPNAPSSLSARASAGATVLSWNDNSANEQGFKIERGLSSKSFSQIAMVGPNTNIYTDTGLTGLTRYYYRVRAYNSIGQSGYSNIVSSR